jgi:hypothetical protein
MKNLLREPAAYFKREPWVAAMLAVLLVVIGWFYVAVGGNPDETDAASLTQKTSVTATPDVNVNLNSEAGRLATTRQIEKWSERLMSDPASQPMILLVTALLFLIVAAGIALDLRILSGWRRGHEGLPIRRFQTPNTPWGLGEVFKVLVLMFFLDLVVSYAIGLTLTLMRLQAVNEALVGASFVRSIIIVFYLRSLVRGRYAGSWADLGFCRSNLPQQARTGLGGYLAMIPIYLLALGLLLVILNLFNLESPVQSPVQVLYTEKNAVSAIAFAIFMGILGPWFEEIVFRGFMYPAFKNRMGVRVGILASAVIFAALHGHGVAFVPILILGLALNVLYERSGSIVPGAVLHMTHNSAMLLITMTIKQSALSSVPL